MTQLAELAALFAVAFLAATIFPAQSELLLAGLVLADRHPVWALVGIASVGNVSGSIVNWVLGRFIARFEGRRWFPISREQVARAERWYQRWGKWSLLLSWMPIIGDPLTVVAGVLREPLPMFVVLVTIAKLGRYIAVALLAGAWVQG